MTALYIILAATCGYILGCFSTGLTVSSERNIDIRKYGSKSTGATNVTRVMGLGMGLITFFGDFAKAVIAVLLGRFAAGHAGGLVAGLTVVLGHNWPVFYRFKGGKGIACSAAVLLMLDPRWALISFACAVAVIALTRYVSLGSLSLLLVCAAAIPASRGFWPDGALSLALLLLGAYRHRDNLRRLASGTENKFSLRRSKNDLPAKEKDPRSAA